MMKMMTCFAAGAVAALLIAQAAAPAPDKPLPVPPEHGHPDVGRYQLVPRGNTPDVWVIDTATSEFRLYVRSQQSTEMPASFGGRMRKVTYEVVK